jgi:hypothetical protein
MSAALPRSPSPTFWLSLLSAAYYPFLLGVCLLLVTGIGGCLAIYRALPFALLVVLRAGSTRLRHCRITSTSSSW